MATFNCDGLGGLEMSLREVAELPQEVVDQILISGAEVVAKAQRRKVKAYGIYDQKSTRHVADDIKPGKPKDSKNGGRVIYVYPKGSRTRGKKKTRNAEILFVNEFGKRGQKPRPAVRDATEESAAATTAAQAQVWDKYLDSKKL